MGLRSPASRFRSPLFIWNHATSARFGQKNSPWVRFFPLLRAVVVPARQAYSHCSSVGMAKRYPSGSWFLQRTFSLSQKEIASSQNTCVMGRSLFSRSERSAPVTAAYCSLVTGRRPSQKARPIETLRLASPVWRLNASAFSGAKS